MYRRIADIKNEADADDVLDELIDRFGDPPPSVTGLINVSLLRNSAAQLGIYEIGQKMKVLHLYLERPDMSKVAALITTMGKRASIVAKGAKPYIAIKILPGDEPVELLRKAVSAMANAN